MTGLIKSLSLNRKVTLVEERLAVITPTMSVRTAITDQIARAVNLRHVNRRVTRQPVLLPLIHRRLRPQLRLKVNKNQQLVCQPSTRSAALLDLPMFIQNTPTLNFKILQRTSSFSNTSGLFWLRKIQRYFFFFSIIPNCYFFFFNYIK